MQGRALVRSTTDAEVPRRSGEPITQLWNPAQLATLLVVPLFVIGRQHGWVAHLPLWVLVGSLVVAQLGTTLARSSGRTRGARSSSGRGSA